MMSFLSVDRPRWMCVASSSRRPVLFPAVLSRAPGQPEPAHGFPEVCEQGACVPGGSLAQAWLVYHASLKCLLYVPVFMCMTTGGRLIMWFLGGVELCWKQPSLCPLFIAFICPEFSSSDFKYSIPLSPEVHFMLVRAHVNSRFEKQSQYADCHPTRHIF